MQKILKLAFTDLKLIFRDPSLRVFLLLPIVLFALIVWAVPALVENYPFLQPYLSLMLIVGIIENTQMFSFISSMVLIDEKESGVASTYGVIPLRKIEYVVSRFLFPYLITVVLNVILLSIQPLYSIPWNLILMISILAALVVPVYALGINVVVKNRMQGMVYIKAFNMLVLIPIAAFFVPESFRHLFGVLPTHWIFQSIEHVTTGNPASWMIIIGLLYFSLLTVWISRLFLKRHFV
jgi:fluoroquinolone transport system permease protein